MTGERPDHARLFAGLAVAEHVRSAVDRSLADVRRRWDRLGWTRADGWHVTLAFIGDLPVADVGAAVGAVEVGAREVAPGADGGAGAVRGDEGRGDEVQNAEDPNAEVPGGGSGSAAGSPGTVGGGGVRTGEDRRSEARVARGTLGLRIDGAAALGGRVLVLDLADRPPGVVAALGASVQTSLAAVGVPVHRRAVRPHVTLARARGRSRVPPAVVADVASAVRVGGGLAAGEPAVRGDALHWEVGEVVLYRSILGRGPARYEVVARAPLGA